MNPFNTLWRTMASCFPGFIVWACSNGLPMYQTVEDARILAIQANPPEILHNGPSAIDVTFNALVVDPRGKAIKYSWRLCPLESEFNCQDIETLLAREPEAFREPLRQVANLRLEGQLDGPTADGMTYAVPAFSPSQVSQNQLGRDVTAPLFPIFLQRNLFNQGLGVWLIASLFIDVEGDPILIGQKRLVYGVDDIAQIAQGPIEQQLGIRFCRPNDAPAGCVVAPIRLANQNPTLEPLLGEITDDRIKSLPPLDANTLVLPRNQSLRIQPSFPAQAQENFSADRVNLQTGQLESIPRQELLSFSWFSVGGQWERALTWPPFTNTLDNVLKVDLQRLRNNRIHGWLVARDQRGGTAWQSLTLEVQP